MFDLHEKLSEFSYGYGVSREFETSLTAKGIKVVPFFPSLLYEKKVGFDVAWKRPGAPLMIQFKLGEQLQRYRRGASGGKIPKLDRPFWRFKIDTTDPTGQFRTLLKAERKGAEVYYVAPRFSAWSEYVRAFQRKVIVENSLLIKPQVIYRAAKKAPSLTGIHSVVYDEKNRYVRSDPIPFEATTLEEAVSHVVARTTAGQSLGSVIRRIYEVLLDPESSEDHPEWQEVSARSIRLRSEFLERIRTDANSEDDAIAITVAAEAWAKGTLTIFASARSE